MVNDRDDITAALWTVRDALAKAGDREGIAAIGRISEELTRLRDEREDIGAAIGFDYVALRTERDEAVRERNELNQHAVETAVMLAKVADERDEAVAALREVEWLAQRAFRGKVSAKTLLDVISRARLSTPKEHAHTADCYLNYNDPANPYCDFSTPKEPTDA